MRERKLVEFSPGPFGHRALDALPDGSNSLKASLEQSLEEGYFPVYFDTETTGIQLNKLLEGARRKAVVVEMFEGDEIRSYCLDRPDEGNPKMEVIAELTSPHMKITILGDKFKAWST